MRQRARAFSLRPRKSLAQTDRRVLIDRERIVGKFNCRDSRRVRLEETRGIDFRRVAPGSTAFPVPSALGPS